MILKNTKPSLGQKMKTNSFYITTTLPYVNADPHIGFALELVQSDAIARYKRLAGYEVFFSTGTDEHGQKIFEAAEGAGEEVGAYVDRYSAEFRKLQEALLISNDTFIRTTSPHHKLAAQEMWKRCSEAGDIYKKSYTGQYCVGCESFKTDKDLDEQGQCLLHPNLKIATLKEENYFFRFSKYADQLLEYLSREDVISPDWRRDEAIAFVKGGLEDFSISREKERLSWGVPVPGDDNQVMYVWFDALTNYISTLGWPEDREGNFKKFWKNGESVQTAGKDQVRFQSLMWQAMLMSAKIKNTDKVVYHGFITSGDQKMSKSLGNVINPLDLVKEYGTDAVRYFLLRHVHPFEDSDVTMEKIKEAYNGGLANGLGNLVSRVLTMAETNFTKCPIFPDNIKKEDDTAWESVVENLESYNNKAALDLVWNKISDLDEYIQKKEPFKLIKLNAEKGKEIIQHLVKELYRSTLILEPFLPETSKKIQELIMQNKKPAQPLFLRKD